MKKHILFLFLALMAGGLFAQSEGGYPLRDVFNGTRAVNLMTTSQVGQKVLAYRISHRFGPINSGGYNFFGLDGPANISLAFDYGIRDNLMVGIARDGLGKVYNGFVKYNVMDQTSDGSKPVTISLYSRANMTSLRDEAADINGFDRYESFSNRMSYITQVMVSRKFGERISVQVAPTWIHHNLVETNADGNDIFAISAVGQFKFTKRIGITAEYSFVLNDHAAVTDLYHNSAGIGLDIVTGGHVFQICLVNSAPINDAFAVPYTFSDWLDGDIRLGFNISRKFWF